MIYALTLNPAIDYVINVPGFEEGKLNKTKKEYKFPGGKGINVSRVLAQLGVQSQNLGFIGGFTGKFIEEQLINHGLQNNFVHVSGDTRINIKLKGEEETEINGLGPSIKQEDLDDLNVQISSLTPEDWLILSGSLPMGVPKDIYVTLSKMAHEQQVPFVVDISDDSLFDVLKYRPSLIKPNEHELADLYNVEFKTFEEMLPYGEKLVQQGARNVIISMGANGAVLFNETGIYRAKGLTGTLVNSVGSGDSVVAGFVSQLSQGKDAVTAFKTGIACGSATAFSADLATSEEINQQLSRVEIDVLKEY
ncbi:1-phosphofructokinase [Vagococcus luciliae]|uniref:Tagatose-6-phosphate kinase n=1 Tax=Vagococcus luciliae TaxID=2920380 RepID=A0ABY5NYE7_9ENTE|nr:1-phosphofructokinase [Vagococcus luciliae]UUV98501.1 Tagatose-6-phosphate kinase [Vagococcus luciliae]